MTPHPDIALCSVSAKSCTHHAHCLRAQLPAHPTRQAYCTPNRRGDECQQFVPIEAFNFTPAGSDAVAEYRPLVEAGGVSTFGAARSVRAVDTQPQSTATNATPSAAPSISAGNGVAGGLGNRTAGGVDLVGSSGNASRLDQYEREQLHAAHVISGRAQS